MAQTIYMGPATLFYLGRPVLETDSITLSVQSNNKAVVTGRRGRSGHTKGPKSYSLKVSNAIPSTGLEVDWQQICDDQEVVTLGVKFANRTYTLEGDLADVELTSEAEGGSAKCSFNFNGKLKSKT